jgi:hypothetical protein
LGQKLSIKRNPNLHPTKSGAGVIKLAVNYRGKYHHKTILPQ